MQRCLKRYIATAAEEEAKAVGEYAADICLQKRRLQYVESCVRLYQNWVSRTNNQTGAAKFMMAWSALHAFCAEKPAVQFDCKFLWRVCLEVLTSERPSARSAMPRVV